MATPCPPPTVRRKVFGDAQPNLLDDLTLFDELDPIPFVAHDDAARRDQPRSDHGGFCEESRDFPNFPSCIVAERREGRASPHWNFDCTGSNPIFECHLLDVTMSGIAIRTVRSFPRGSILDVRFNPTNSENVIETSGIVVRCEPSKAGGFQVVCRLEKFLRFAEIRDVGRDLFASAIV